MTAGSLCGHTLGPFARLGQRSLGGVIITLAWWRRVSDNYTAILIFNKDINGQDTIGDVSLSSVLNIIGLSLEDDGVFTHGIFPFRELPRPLSALLSLARLWG